MKKLLRYLKGYTLFAILAPLTIIVEVVMELLIPRVMSKIIDVGIPSGDLNYVLKLGLLMVSMALLSLFFGVISGTFASRASVGFAANIRKALFHKIQGFSFANIDRFSTASLVTRVTTDVTNTQGAFMMMIRIMFRAPCMMIFAAIMAFSINKSLFTMFYVAIPLLAAIVIIIMISAYPRFQELMRRYDGLNSSVQENLAGIRVVKAYVRENHESEKFREASKKLRDTTMKAEKLVIINMPAMSFIMYGCMIAVNWFGGKDIIAGNMTTGELMSYVSYVSQILMSLMMVSMIFISMVLSRASIARINEVLDDEPTITDETADPDLLPTAGEVVFDHVSFGYGKTDVLRDVSLTIPAGSMVGIIGATGSGKSSLVQLIPRLYDVSEGRVLVDGHDVREYTLDNLRNNVAMVLQKNVLFSGSIRENLKWGDPDATDEMLFDACRAAQAHEFITSFPDGYETELGQGGVNVSGGQKQRLCIARALLKHPKVLIMDDSTSAVDMATDAKLREALRKERGDVTTIIIAQRIASVQDADEIIVMDDGEISAVGTHDELMKTSEIYRDVYTSQVKEAD